MSLAADMSQPQIPEGRAKLVRTISSEGGIAVRSIIGSNLVAEAMNAMISWFSVELKLN